MFRRGITFVEAHHHGPHGSLRYEVGGVGGDPAAGIFSVQAVQVLADAAPVPVEIRRVAVPAGDLLPNACQCCVVHGCVGEPVLAQQFSGDALAEFGVVVPVDQQLEVGVGVHVNETGAQDQAVRIDDAIRSGSGEAAGVGHLRDHGTSSRTSAVRRSAPLPSTTVALLMRVFMGFLEEGMDKVDDGQVGRAASVGTAAGAAAAVAAAAVIRQDRNDGPLVEGGARM